ncbi:MAG: 1-(5-phosphoribosyl)-5-[(5-phosphoribosylamino)methylideneamino]imidazole-4-carboxamide isomerase [Anaerolineae bacterium]|jgi:phosphoribosylformimino-5-aminoimidazole carboxamide ribotide isomerase|nr:1-(5-phosphoribosyl)-5-[(5-phosphoribosylamino)methylideneamino]imidazole-4-carboxamide isomerase [Anaerolineae bacterium]
MIIYPAIDLRGGQVVRLREGDPNRQTTFSDDPIAVARQWIEQGAQWLHIVNLDGAFSEANSNDAIVKQITALGVNVQFGGGIRSLQDLENALEAGVKRVVLGTVAVAQPELLAPWVTQFGADRLCVALDAREGKVTTHGWQQMSEVTPIEFGRQIAQFGIQHVLYTDVHRDGSLIGANVHETIALGRSTGLAVIASGGVSTINEIAQLARSGVVAGAVIGMALYEGRITLAEAFLAASLGA